MTGGNEDTWYDLKGVEMGTAILSPCGNYRYLLGRRWSDGGLCCFVMLNPSTADADKDDPTIRRCIGYAKREGMGALEVVNLFAYRATDPKSLLNAKDPIGPENDKFLREVFKRADLIVCAWGNHGAFKSRDLQVEKLIGAKAKCLGVTSNNHPRHPLRVRKDAPLLQMQFREGVD